MLQQTQVKTVVPYFKHFTKKYKTLRSVSRCREKEILKLWEGLGYYRRARNFLATVKILVKEHQSKLPETLEGVKKFPGVGEYTANALLGLIHDQPKIAIDGNKSIIQSTDEFIGAPVMATELRASVSLVLAGLVAKGETTINTIYHIDRGYEEIEKKLSQCGGIIKRQK